MTRWLTVHDRPAAFDLTKYAPLESTTTEGWHHQLRKRDAYARDMQIAPEAGLQLTDMLMDEPIRPMSGYSAPEHRRRVNEAMDAAVRGRSRAAVGSMTIGGAQALAEWMERNGLMNDSNDGLLYRLVDDENAQRDDQFQDPSMALVHVNLDMPTDVLKAEFSKWLTAARDARSVSSAGSQIEIGKWADRRLLPYFDLWLWAVARSARWRNDALAEILFGHDSERDGAYVSNVVRVKAVTMMSRRMLRRLSVEAMREDDGR